MSFPQAQIRPYEEAEGQLKATYRTLLGEARERTLALVEGVDGADLDRAHSPLMSPLAWDLGHMAAFEDLWLCQRAGGLEPLRGDLAQVYDAAETPRANRGRLPHLRAGGALAFMEAVRERALGVLEAADLSPGGDPLTAGGFVWEMLVQHEHQHNETMLQTLQIAAPGTYRPRRREPPPAPASPPGGMVEIPAGPFRLGAGPDGFAYDNERPRHLVELPAFRIDRAPLTAGAYLEWMEAGGYARREWWSEEGWAWRCAAGVQHPFYWSEDATVRSFDRIEAADPALPVMHVSFHEAEAYARAHGKRLPTEAEWERAARGDLDGAAAYPWGDGEPSVEHANLDSAAYGPAPAGTYPAGASPAGVLGMIGDVWEWTAGELGCYPGFRAFPYREYSEVFFGRGYRVLRGGSWATRPRAIRNTFRNWDYPQRRQIFAGFRCAEDA